MRTIIVLLVSALLVSAAVNRGAYVEGSLLAKFKATVSLKAEATPFATGNVVLDSLNKMYHCRSIEPVCPRLQRNGTGSLLSRNYILTFKTGVEIDTLATIYAATGLFDYVELDGIIHSNATVSPAPYIPNDPYFNRQWALNNDGTFTGSGAVIPKKNADINMPEAWDQERGDSSVIVAVLDAGCAMNHPELIGRIWKNPKEIPGNGIDDDANGFIDDVNGWDFGNNTNNPVDQDGHGTAIAGIIGANTNNGIEFAGINPNAKILVVKILDSTGTGSTSRMVKGINYAIVMGARVINLSLTGSLDVQTGHDAIRAAYDKGITIVAAAGNDNSNKIYYPAAYPEVIAVGATGPDDNRYSASPTLGSNNGAELDIVAPGSFIYMLDMHNFNQYISGSGTSCSAAFVTGVVSLLLAQNPALTPTQVQDILQKSADDQVGNPNEDTKGWDKYYGWGRLNAYKALLRSSAAKHLPYRPQISRGEPRRAFAVMNNPFRAEGYRYTLDGRIVTRALAQGRFEAAAPGVYIRLLRPKRE